MPIISFNYTEILVSKRTCSCEIGQIRTNFGDQRDIAELKKHLIRKSSALGWCVLYTLDGVYNVADLNLGYLPRGLRSVCKSGRSADHV